MATLRKSCLPTQSISSHGVDKITLTRCVTLEKIVQMESAGKERVQETVYSLQMVNAEEIMQISSVPESGAIVATKTENAELGKHFVDLGTASWGIVRYRPLLRVHSRGRMANTVLPL